MCFLVDGWMDGWVDGLLRDINMIVISECLIKLLNLPFPYRLSSCECVGGTSFPIVCLKNSGPPSEVVLPTNEKHDSLHHASLHAFFTYGF